MYIQWPKEKKGDKNNDLQKLHKTQKIEQYKPN